MCEFMKMNEPSILRIRLERSSLPLKLKQFGSSPQLCMREFMITLSFCLST